MYYINRCSHAPTVVYAIGDVVYFGADRDHASDFEGELIVNFTPYPNLPTAVSKIPSLAKHLSMQFKEIMIPWPDMGVPRVKPEFWQALHSYIKKSKFKHVCFHCQAGHGRTGTALAAMLIANQGFEATEATNMVRENYCNEAVESFSQKGYLRSLDLYFNNREFSEEDIYSDDCPPSLLLRHKSAMESADTSGVQVEDDEEESSDEQEHEVSMYESPDDEEEKKIIFD